MISMFKETRKLMQEIAIKVKKGKITNQMVVKVYQKRYTSLMLHLLTSIPLLSFFLNVGCPGLFWFGLV